MPTRQAQAELRFATAVLLSCFAVCKAAASSPAQLSQRVRKCGLADESSLLQQQGILHAPSSTMPSARSDTASLMDAFEGLRREAEGHKLEDALRLYESGQRLANLSGVSTEEKGLMLLQEALKIFDSTSYEKAVAKHRDPERWFKKSDIQGCYSSYMYMPLNWLGALFSLFVTIRCDRVGNCVSEGIETFRYLLVAMQHREASKSYCAEKFSMNHTCRAAGYDLASNVAGLSAVIAGVTYKCPEYAGGEADKTIVSLKVSDISCGLGYGKGATYLATAVHRIADMTLGLAELAAQEEEGPTPYFIGQNKTALSSLLGATFAWMTQLVLLSVGNCKEEAGALACGQEITELVAFVAQAITSALMVNSYCLEPDNQRPPTEKDTDTAKEKTIPLGEQMSVDNPVKTPKTGDSDDLAESANGGTDNKKLKDAVGSLMNDERLGDAVGSAVNDDRVNDVVGSVMDDERVSGVVDTVMKDKKLTGALGWLSKKGWLPKKGSAMNDERVKDVVGSVMDNERLKDSLGGAMNDESVTEAVDTVMKDNKLTGWLAKAAAKLKMSKR